MRGCIVKQLIAALVCAQTFVILGFTLGSGSVLFEQETANSTTRRLSLGQVTWVVSAFTLGNIPGTLMSMYASPRLGAPRLLLACLPLALAGAAMVGLDASFGCTLAGRLLVGFYFGTVEGPARAYVGEVTGRTVRGVISSLLNIATPVSMVVVLALGASWPWHTIECALVTSASVLQAVGLPFLPQSPKWLLAHGHDTDLAKTALRFFHGADTDVKQAIAEIERSLSSQACGAGFLSQLRLVFRRRENVHPLLLLLVQFFCLVFSGGIGVSQFAPTIFRSAGEDAGSYLSSIYVMVATSVAFLLSAPLLERCSRVLLLQVTGLIGLVGCTAVGAYFFLEQHSWLVLTGALAITFSYGAGIAPASFTYLVELLPNSVRAVAINLVLLYFSVVQFLAIYCFPSMVDRLGSHVTFWLFGAVNVLQVVLATFWLPETRGLSLEQIQSRFFAPTETRHADDLCQAEDGVARRDVGSGRQEHEQESGA